MTEINGNSIENSEIAVKGGSQNCPNKTVEDLADKAAALKLLEDEKKEETGAAALEADTRAVPKANDTRLLQKLIPRLLVRLWLLE